MKINNLKSISFKGFENILATEFEASPIRFSTMSMELNNIGQEDLNKWHEIQRNFLKNNNPKDVITFHLVKNKTQSVLAIDGIALKSGEQLKALESLNKLSKDEEMNTMKAYTFIADLTKRIMNTSITDINFATIGKVVEDATKNISKIINKPSIAHSIIERSFFSKPQRIALHINRDTCKTVSKFFI